MNQHDKLIQARSRLMRSDVGIASMLLGLDLVESESHDTMATDGERIFWNENFVAETSNEELQSILIHEALHVVFEHPLRRGGRNHKLFNIACDYAINSYIVYDLRLPLPEGALLDRKYHKMSAEQIYTILDTNDDALQDAINQANASNGEGDDSESNESQDCDGDSEGSEGSENLDEEETSTGKYSSEDEDAGEDGAGDKYSSIPALAGEVLDAQNEEGKPLTPVEQDELRQAIRSKIFLADKIASMDGTSSLRGAVENVKNANIDWLDVVADFLTGSIESFSSWNRLNKRHQWRGVNLPTNIKENGGGELAIMMDTSCSVSQAELNYCASVVQYICEMLGIEKIRVCYCDTVVRKNQQGEWWDTFELSQGEDLEFELRGGGGTSFDPPFNLFNEYSDDVEDVCAIIYFTDGYGEVSASVEPLSTPVLWAITNNGRAYEADREEIPFGEFVQVDVSGAIH